MSQSAPPPATPRVADHPAVEVRDLGHLYPAPRARPGGGRRALDGVSFSVRPGEVFGFLGPNGGGKTTLFRILATLITPRQGEVTVGGAALPGGRAAVRRKLGVVFQSPSLDRELTVAENLRCQGGLYGLGGRELARRSAELLGRFGLADRADDRVETLSGGLRRRAEIAKALLHDPEILLLDEPSTGLDPGARRDLWQTLEGLVQGDGMTVLVTTHFIEEAERADRLVLLDGGRIVADGSPAELVAKVGEAVVTIAPTGPPAEAEAASVALGREIAERFAAEGIEPTVHRGRVRFEHGEAHRLVARLAEALPGRIDSLTVARPTLEDVFLHHTGRGLSEDAARAAGPAGEAAA